MDLELSQQSSTEQALAERMRFAQLIAAVGIALTGSDSLDEILGRCAEALVTHLDAAFARIWILNEEEQVLELRASRGIYTHLNGAHGRVPVGKFKIGLIAEERKPHLTNAVLGDPRVADQQWAAQEGMVSFAGYPLIVGDRLVGVMAMFARVALSPATLEAMESVAHGIALGIERLRSQDAVRASTDELARILESITDGFASLDRHFRYKFVNSEGARVLGKRVEELLGRSIYDVFPDIKGTSFEAALKTAMADQKPQEVEEYFAPLGGWFSLRIFPAVDGLSIYYHDETQRKLSEQRLKLQYAVSRSLENPQDLESSAPELLQAIGEALSWRLGLLWTPDRERKTLRCLATWQAPDSPSTSAFLQESCSDEFLSREAFPGFIWQTAEPQWVTDFAVDMRFPRSKLAAEDGLHSAFGFPILSRGEVVGVAEFFSGDIRRPDEEFLHVVRAIGHQIGQYLERYWSAEALRESDVRKSAILETAVDAIITIDSRSRIVELNPAAEAIFGYRRDEVIGRLLPELIVPPRLREGADQGLRRYLASSEGRVLGSRVELPAVRADGTEFPVEVAVTRVPIEGRILYTVYLRDITLRRKSELERAQLLARAEAAQRYYQVLAETMPQQVWTANPDGTLDYVNERVVRYFGMPAKTIVGNGWRDLVHPEDMPVCAERWTAALNTGEPYEVEFRLQRADGSYRWHLGRALPVRDMDGSITKWLGTNTDLHDRMEAQEQLRRAKDIAEAASQAKSEFLARMSHELRTPLNAIIGYSEMLEEEAQERNLEPFLSDLPKIHGAGKHLLSLINDVLDLSKIEAGKMELFVETFDVHEMIESVVNTVRPLAAKNGNELIVDCETGLGEMSSDLTKIRQSLFNLLSNSSKFTHDGRIRLQASRQRRDDQDWLLFRVEDTGIGIPAEKTEGVFDPFSQVDKGRTRKYGGTGLGLAITKRFCEIMGGGITLESEPGKGSIFEIKLPSQLKSTAPAEHSALQSETSDNTILIVDDDPAAQELMRRFLEREGFHTAPAMNGQQALEMVRALKPIAITLDVMMPGMDGWSVLSALKSDPETAEIPVIVVSIIDDKNLGYALGAAEYLTKPIDRERFSQVMNKYRCVAGDCPVLIVEDDEAVRHTLRSVLERHGWSVLEAANGVIALEVMAKEKPELIILDLIMPEMDGFEFSEEMRKNEDWRSIPVIILTSKDLTPEERDRLNGNVDRVLRKQRFAMPDLLREIQGITARRARQS
jgi:PAS domain S-box-containing protein